MAHESGVTMERASVASAQASQVSIIQRTWAEILGVERVGPGDDFFDLGGHSLLVPSAVDLLGSRVGIDLQPRALFEAPTPAEMAELIAELRVGPAPLPIDGMTPFTPDWVVTLQPEGAGRPVFVFPGGLGGKWILHRDAQIAALVGRQHPFFGFRRDRQQVVREGHTVPAMAAAYVEQIRVLQGSGPYLLYGICSGGALAWEAAAQLLAAGETIGGLLFFEAPLRAGHADITPAVAPARAVLPGLVPTYTPDPLPVDLTLLMTEAWHRRGRSDGWAPLVRGRVERVLMPGDSPGAHNLYAGREATIAAHVRDWIVQAEERWRAP
jgi:hypothetical protein